MASSKEIKLQILGIRKIQKITSAMRNVAASKMRRAQQHMENSMPYATKISEVVMHVACHQHEYQHPYLQNHKRLRKVGYIIVSTDRGLCGGLNLNLFKIALEQANNFQKDGVEVEWCLFGKKAEVFFRNVMASVVAHASSYGHVPKVSDLLGSIKVMLDAYNAERIDKLFIIHNEFVSTIVQKPVITQLLPITEIKCYKGYHRSYLYEPAAKVLLDTLMMRYIESQVYQAVVDNIACEQVARMVAMKNATDNSEEVIDSLQLMYNKARQAAITREIAEIVGGAEAV
ncbi:MAG: F0F1 ATP synthase subunit gamma [Coxiellaceae bacterium]|jgi:F-type H+-transporting ATPase subunit gamma|nr:F0F1 ATP synthase subunit gamma [Coxiellaceae bacterium]